MAASFSQPTAAATRTWTGLGLTNNWNDVLNWSGGVVPGAADVATFDATSSKNAALNVAVNVAGISIAAGYTGTIAQAGNAVTVGASGWTQTGGTFVGGAAAVPGHGPPRPSAGGVSAPTATPPRFWAISVPRGAPPPRPRAQALCGGGGAAAPAPT